MAVARALQLAFVGVFDWVVVAAGQSRAGPPRGRFTIMRTNRLALLVTLAVVLTFFIARSFDWRVGAPGGQAEPAKARLHRLAEQQQAYFSEHQRYAGDVEQLGEPRPILDAGGRIPRLAIVADSARGTWSAVLWTWSYTCWVHGGALPECLVRSRVDWWTVLMAGMIVLLVALLIRVDRPLVTQPGGHR